MDRIQLLARSTLSQTLASIFRTLNETRRVRSENGLIDALHRDRLEDIGIAPRSETNQRHSGEYGHIPKVQLW